MLLCKFSEICLQTGPKCALLLELTTDTLHCWYANEGTKHFSRTVGTRHHRVRYTICLKMSAAFISFQHSDKTELCQYMPSCVFSSQRNKWHILVGHTTKKLDSILSADSDPVTVKHFDPLTVFLI
jgi:uncharacterized protein (DUF2237 family)